VSESSASNDSRYIRQVQLPQIGRAGQDRLAAATVLLVGCGALGCTIAEQLARAGVGTLRIADRDIVERSNLQRQVLFGESDADAGLPKPIAARQRIAQINSSIRIDARTVDVDGDSIGDLVDGNGSSGPVDLILDGTDNVRTRYLINDVAVQRGIPWIYGGCVGVEGRVMTIVPGKTACLRCVFPDPPAADQLPTCDTAGVLGPAAQIVGVLQAAAAIRYLVEGAWATTLLSVDAWTGRFHALDLSDARRQECVCCGQRQFSFLGIGSGQSAVSLCGRDAVQIRAARATGPLTMSDLAGKLQSVGDVQFTEFFLRCRLHEPAGLSLTVFPDGRALVHGTNDPARARSIYARFVGA
jgi:adenylyltransferase/sulfurtransferase